MKNTQYIYVPGLHTSPNKYCSSAYGSELAKIDHIYEQVLISDQLNSLKHQGKIKHTELWIQGTTDVEKYALVKSLSDVKYGDEKGEELAYILSLLVVCYVTDIPAVIYSFIRGSFSGEFCVRLSNWSEKDNGFTSLLFNIFSTDCKYYKRHFLCESLEGRQ